MIFFDLTVTFKQGSRYTSRVIAKIIENTIHDLFSKTNCSLKEFVDTNLDNVNFEIAKIINFEYSREEDHLFFVERGLQ